MASGEPAVEAEGLNFSYSKEPILKNIDLRVGKGEFVGIMGPVGSGKTTLLLTLNGAIPNLIRGNFKGSVKVLGADTKNSKVQELARSVGMVFQDPNSQIFSLTVRDEMSFALENFGFQRKEIERRIEAALGMLNLSEFINEDPGNLSEGQKKKLAIASIIVLEPEMLLLDEPAAGLDYHSSRTIYNFLDGFNKSGKTVVVVEHDAEALVGHASRVIVIDKGEIRLDGSPEQVFSSAVFESLGLKAPCSVEISKKLGLEATVDKEKLVKKLVGRC